MIFLIKNTSKKSKTLRALPSRATRYSPFGFWLPPCQSPRVPPKKLRSKSFRLLPRTSPVLQVCIYQCKPHPIKRQKGRGVAPAGRPEGREGLEGMFPPPASFGPSPALRLLPSRALSSVTADRILYQPALACKAKNPEGCRGAALPC